MAVLRSFVCIQYLNVSGAGVTQLLDEALPHSLVALNISKTKIPARRIPTLNVLSLKSLSIDGIELTASQWDVLASGALASSLVYLSASSCSVHVKVIEILGLNLKQLQFLDLSHNNGVDDECAQFMVFNLTKIKYVDLTATMVGPKSLKQLSEAWGCRLAGDSGRILTRIEQQDLAASLVKRVEVQQEPNEFEAEAAATSRSDHRSHRRSHRSSRPRSHRTPRSNPDESRRPTKLFGIPLKECQLDEGIPSLLTAVFRHLYAHERFKYARHLFEMPSNPQALSDLKLSMESTGELGVDCDPQDAAALMTLFFAELPSGVIPPAMLTGLEDILAKPNEADHPRALRRALTGLSSLERRTMQQVLWFLSKVVSEESTNGMSLSRTSNVLGKVMFPTINPNAARNLLRVLVGERETILGSDFTPLSFAT
eukprot:c18872_g1_i2.p2 GENE.c18872_g1_i2~~c18872_g1_i2.p2  ORF type:complete len:427 (+),score=64.72 c18872_g1_i2:1507-2787(+)